MPISRKFWANLLAAFLLLSAIDLHTHEGSLDALAYPQGETYSRTAERPGQPAHFEDSCDTRRPLCPVCLHHQRISGAHLLAVAELEPLARQDDGAQGRPLLSGHDVRSASGARGPPAV